ncbi:hypothetical protein A2U01_0092054, partial [Trifolium medium]|nr:hypothetical protein [Trifolium medium]
VAEHPSQGELAKRGESSLQREVRVLECSSCLMNARLASPRRR